MSLTQIINHEVERGIPCDDPVFSHQQQVRAAAHFVDGHLRTVEYRAHADCPHEPRRLPHAVRMQDNMRNAYRGSLIVLTHVLVPNERSSVTLHVMIGVVVSHDSLKMEPNEQS